MQKAIDDFIQAGWTQNQLAEMFGCVQGNISKIWAGDRPDPQFSLGTRILETHRKFFPRSRLQQKLRPKKKKSPKRA